MAEGQELAPCFNDLCSDGHEWMTQEGRSDEDANRVRRVFEDYMVMRRAAREENHILALNRVGIERNQKKLVDGVARHVGL